MRAGAGVLLAVTLAAAGGVGSGCAIPVHSGERSALERVQDATRELTEHPAPHVRAPAKLGYFPGFAVGTLSLVVTGAAGDPYAYVCQFTPALVTAGLVAGPFLLIDYPLFGWRRERDAREAEEATSRSP